MTTKRSQSFEHRIDLPGVSEWHDVVTTGAIGSVVRFPLSPELRSLTISAATGNDAAGNIYYGDVGVTNAAGAKPGTDLARGDKVEGIAVRQANVYYLTADTANQTAVLKGVFGFA